MPHQNIPESWMDALVVGIVTVFWWVVRKLFGKIGEIEHRIALLEGEKQAGNERHAANLKRLDSIEHRSESIEEKLDRLIERI